MPPYRVAPQKKFTKNLYFYPNDPSTMPSGKTRDEGFAPPEKPSPRPGRSWFLGIGIDRYQYFSDLNNAVKDVKDFQQLLIERYGQESDFSITLFDEEATRSNIIQALDRLAQEAQETDKLLIYYSGHGHLREVGSVKQGFWIPSNAGKDHTDQYIRNSTIRDYVQLIPAMHTLVISDACFSGALMVRSLARSATALEELERRHSRWVLCSGRHDQKVSDGPKGDNSPFAKSLLYLLRKNQHPLLNIGYISEQVVGMTRANYDQLPEGCPLQGVGHMGGQYVFRLEGAEVNTQQLSPPDPKAPEYPLRPPEKPGAVKKQLAVLLVILLALLTVWSIYQWLPGPNPEKGMLLQTDQKTPGGPAREPEKQEGGKADTSPQTEALDKNSSDRDKKEKTPQRPSGSKEAEPALKNKEISYIFKGNVSDAASGSYISGAEILINGKFLGTTDDYGSFSLEHHAAKMDKVNFTARKPGYREYVMERFLPAVEKDSYSIDFQSVSLTKEGPSQ
ncbi:MAG: caspase family protein [Lewinellaceae bacterium]|nr:caspase family protein [Lewinellaceae bacterium]MCB9286813.1 caspase family protein [Lewinellaceae bacterium]